MKRIVAITVLFATTSAFAEDTPLLPRSDAVFDHHLTLTAEPGPAGMLKTAAIFADVGAGVLLNATLAELLLEGYGLAYNGFLGKWQSPGLWPGPTPLFVGSLVSFVVGIGLHIASTRLASE
jgi:hypothetical protein